MRGLDTDSGTRPFAAVEDLDRSAFFHNLIVDLAEVIEENVGPEDAGHFITLVGTRTGRMIDEAYRQKAGAERLGVRQVADTLVDLKRRIGAGFSIESVDERRIVLVNDRCPFARQANSLCMMTSNVFGRIAADNLGYARVDLQQTLSGGDPCCRVVIDMVPDGAGAGREYYG